MRSLVALLFVAFSLPALAATPESYAALDRASAAACRTASGLREATAGPPTRFSDALLIDTRVVTGIWPQKHMKGASATMLCAYNRRTKRVEVQEVPAGFVPTVGSVALRDIQWQATEIGRRRPVGNVPLTLKLGTDGMMTGSTGCNGFQGQYTLTGTTLVVPRPLIATQRGCGGDIGPQESRYLQLLAKAVRAERGAKGSLVVTTRDGRVLRYIPSPKG